jgi:hypothetical protein
VGVGQRGPAATVLLGTVAVSPCSVTFTVDAYDRSCAASHGLELSSSAAIWITVSQLD